ncbi:golvesin C-terminal-like domain-containing protein [Larkinella sp. GY13]
MTIRHADGKQPLTINQRAKGGQWILLRKFRFEKGYKESICGLPGYT